MSEQQITHRQSLIDNVRLAFEENLHGYIETVDEDGNWGEYTKERFASYVLRCATEIAEEGTLPKGPKYEDDYAVFPTEMEDIPVRLAAIWIGWREAVRRHLYKVTGLRTKVDDYITYCQGYIPSIEGFYGMEAEEAEKSYAMWCDGTLGI